MHVSSTLKQTQHNAAVWLNADMSWAAFKRPKEPQSAPNGMRVSLFRFPREAERKPTILCPHLETTGLCAFRTGDPLLACLCLWRHRRRVRRGAIKARTRRALSHVFVYFCWGRNKNSNWLLTFGRNPPLYGSPCLGWEDCLSGLLWSVCKGEARVPWNLGAPSLGVRGV